MNQENFSDSKPVAAIAAVTLASGTLVATGVEIDTQFFNSLVIPLDFDWTTDGQIDSIKFQESDVSGSGFADVPAGDNLFYPGSFPITADALIHAGCTAKKRYVKIIITASGFTSGGIAIPKTAGLLQNSLTKPMAKESSVIADASVISPGVTGDASTTAPKR